MIIKELTSKKLLRLFDANFYEKIDTFEKFEFYLGSLVHLICKENNVDTPKYIIFVDMPAKKYASYSVNLCTIFLNSRFRKIFKKCKQIKNNFYIFTVLNALLHELRHHFQNIEKFTQISPLVKSFNSVYQLSRANYDYKALPYLTNLIEIDARYYAYQVMNDAGMFDDFLSSDWFKKWELCATKIGFPLAKIIHDQQQCGQKEIQELVDVLKIQYDSILVKNKINLQKFQEIFEDAEKSERFNVMEGLLLYKSIAPDFFNMNYEDEKTKQASKKIEAWQKEFDLLYNEKIENSFSDEGENEI